MANKNTLDIWQKRLETGQSSYDSAHEDFTRMHKLYEGTQTEIDKLFPEDKVTRTHVLRNICQEIIESEVNTAIPMPKVTARRKQDEDKAKLIEDMIRDKLDEINMEMLNDTVERMVPTYGGAFWFCEWDNSMRNHDMIGDSTIRVLHPKQIVPQPGITASIDEMDWIIIKLPMTRTRAEKLYKVTLPDETEQEPELRSGVDAADTAPGMITVYHGYYRNDEGGIGLYAWTGDTELADYDDYQARRLRHCAKCGAKESDIQPMERQTTDGTYPGPTDPDSEEFTEKPKRTKKNACPYCGSTKWEESSEDFEEFTTPPIRSDGTPIFTPMQETFGTGTFNEAGEEILSVRPQAVQIPFYKPDMFPIEVHRNTSIYGKLLGESDIAKIETQQNAINRVEEKIIQKAMTGGSYRTIPADATVMIDSTEGKRYVVDDPSKMAMFSAVNMELNVAQELELEEHYYQNARQIIGITDSFQGRTDKTATSGKAKEFSAAQAAGRLESKRKNKEAAFQKLFELLFKFELAYADEPRAVRVHTDGGQLEYRDFVKWDFLEYDENTQEYWWNDMFLFSCDTATPLANNREAMWQETRENFSAGTFGNPQDLNTLIMFWQKMEMLHYPGAGETKRYLENLQRQQEEMQMQQQMQEQALQEQQAAQAAQQADMARQDAAAEQQMQIIDKARQDAQNAAQAAQAAQMPQ